MTCDCYSYNGDVGHVPAVVLNAPSWSDKPHVAAEFLRSLGLPDDPDDLLTPEEHAALNAHLANLADQRRRVAVESGHLPVGGKERSDDLTLLREVLGDA
jgi:hypothetical protein